MISSASPIKNTIRGARKWLSVSAALIFSEVDIGRMDSSMLYQWRMKTIIGDQRSIAKAAENFVVREAFSPLRPATEPSSELLRQLTSLSNPKHRASSLPCRCCRLK
jgi:hypothetical protein